MQDKEISILDHLEELRKRLILCVVVIIIGSAIAYKLVPSVLQSLIKPVGKLVFINPTEAFWVNLKLSLMIGAYFSLPVIFYQIWKFIARGLRKNERGSILPLAVISFLLFNFGAWFCYLFIVPLGIKFLLSYSLGIIEPMISVNSYLTFITVMLLSFGLIFELPLIIGFLTRLGIVSPKGLIKYRRLAIVVIFIIAAVLTPPDIFTQTSLALPLLLLYEVSILVAKKIHKNHS
jgi:sec-independent protein translocase protein TatC